ncbi:hypothetical protein AK812_SmicGene15050 [Symbiodinium microadriaticum]|uniref:Uncharacterized protein n=1 Tax=Symbiodinium microadriaticum TaxID=2951 RepID=A0A1Q9E410_SYMMI|nr:hypothetical protein AK812_SmicGene15050 [Symbiodinium microadriaticum]
MYLAALEEYLLLTTLHGLLDPAQLRDLPPAITMASRNDLVHTALQKLHGDARDHFLRYADSLASAIQGSIDVPYPPMPIECPVEPSLAERRAMSHLSERSGSLWNAVREVVSMIQFAPDTRPYAQGYTFVLGAYSKGGLVGLSKATKAHPATCTLLNAAVHMIAERHHGYNWHYHEVNGVFTAGQLYKTSATSAASSATSGLTGYGTGQQGANQGGHPGIFIDLTDEDDPPHSFQSLDTTVTATGNDTNMLRDTANDHHAAQPLSLPSFLQLMD